MPSMVAVAVAQQVIRITQLALAAVHFIAPVVGVAVAVYLLEVTRVRRELAALLSHMLLGVAEQPAHQAAP
jgi:hypothetical protein